jgi:hypothetical protein
MLSIFYKKIQLNNTLSDIDIFNFPFGINKYAKFEFKEKKYSLIKLLFPPKVMENIQEERIQQDMVQRTDNISRDTVIIALDKDSFYRNKYQKNDFYWGFGIEQETYIDTGTTKKVQLKDSLKSIKRERYSIDYCYYYKDNHKQNIQDLTIEKVIEIPIWLNCHAFVSTDFKRNHKTKYTKLCEPNPKFEKPIIESLKQKNSFFNNEEYKNYIFDGDTIEFFTRDFYKIKIEDTIQELENKKNNFITNLQSHLVKWKAGIPKIYHGITNLWTSSSTSYAIFNNGTYHLNLTLPTQMDADCRIKDLEKFKKDHLLVIRWLQWFEPLLIGLLGYPDFYSSLFPNEPYAKGSLRCSISRYIGIGTFHPENPVEGKQLNTLTRLPWMQRVQDESMYELNVQHGYDFNFLKHTNHGIEWRIFDAFPEEYLENVCLLMLWIADFALMQEVVPPVAQESKIWNDVTFDCVFKNGSLAVIPNEYLKHIGVETDNDVDVETALQLWLNTAEKMFLFRDWGVCVQNMTSKRTRPVIPNFNKYISNKFKEMYTNI